MKNRNLPHKDGPELWQFITFRTHDSMDPFLHKMAKAQGNTSKKQMRMDVYLDQSDKGSYLRDQILKYMTKMLEEEDKQLFNLAAYAVMPNHVHLLVKPLKPLAEMMNLLKGKSAREINRQLNRKGAFWARDYFDRGIRDEQHFAVVYRYIRDNPLKLRDGDEVGRFYGIYGNAL